MAALTVDVLIVGGGAAGLMCAIEAGKRGRSVVVLEHNAAIGRKILISGGGRCNFTNLHTRPENFVSANPHFVKSALSRYTPRDFIEMVERHRIKYHEKTLGQLCCDESAEQIVNMLLEECEAAGVRIVTGASVEHIERGEAFRITTASTEWQADSLVIATGGLSIPKMGATNFGYQVARQFGIKVTECRPALVPLTFGSDDEQRYRGLAGVASDSEVTAGDARFREKLLFTHRGLSGPSILQASTYWQPGSCITIDLMPGQDLAAALKESRASKERAEVRSIAARFVPKRLADRWFELGLPSRPAVQLSDREITVIARAFHEWAVRPAGTEGYAKAEVTAGGIDTNELSSKTMEAKKVPGLYFIGEVVDVTGQLGGFNFQWAWAAGYSAGQFV